MQDFATARKWYEAAAAQGNVSAMVDLGQLHYLGHGTPQNYARAAEWFAKAAEKGHPRAINNLGMAYLDGMGVEMDRKKAGQYFIRAAKLGNAHAQYNLATLYVQHPDVLTAAGPDENGCPGAAMVQKKRGKRPSRRDGISG